MAAPDVAALLVAGRVLSETDVLALRAALEPPWKARQRRLEARAAAIRAALGATGADGAYAGACQLARVLDGLSRGRRGYEGALGAAAAEVLRLNDGAPIGWRTILRSIEGDTVINTSGDDSEQRGPMLP